MAKRLSASSEMARTDVHVGAARVFIVACLLSLISVPLFQHVLPAGDDSGLRAGPFADFVAAVRNLNDGETPTSGGFFHRFLASNRALNQSLDDLERELEQRSHLRELTLPTAQMLLLAYGGIGNERVIAGQDGWLYLRGGFEYLTGPPFLDPSVLRQRRLAAPAWESPPEPDPRPAMLDFARQLETRGIHLLILPAPTQAMVHPEPLTARPLKADRPLQNPSFGDFQAELEAAGITVFDPLPAMIRARQETGEEPFLRTDSHWSPAGLDAVAHALAERIESLELPFTGRTVRWRRRPQSIEGQGDLGKVLRLPAEQQLIEPQTVQVQRVISATRQPWRPDPRAEILLLGDSFTNVYSQSDVGWGRGAGLAEQLSYFLERPIDRLAINAGGASETRQRLAQELATGRDRLSGKKLVIFQFAIRDLAVGDWPSVDLFRASENPASE